MSARAPAPGATAPRPPFELYLITPDGAPDQVLATVRAALSRGPTGRIAVQLRAKRLPAAGLFELASALRAVTRDRGVSLLINDRADVACAVGADGVQLPEQGLPLAAARRVLGNEALIGASCHDAAGLVRAAEHGANFATLSPVFHSPGKGAPLGVERFAALTRAARLPVYALGGVRPEHVAPLRAAGAAGIALISAVFAAADPAAALGRCLTAPHS